MIPSISEELLPSIRSFSLLLRLTNRDSALIVNNVVVGERGGGESFVVRGCASAEMR